MNIAGSFFFIGLFLAAMGTFLAPLLAMILHRLTKQRPSANTPASSVPSEGLTLDILIPAHNEPLSLPASIASFQKLRDAAAMSSNIQMRIVAGLSNWNDSTAQQAAAMADQVIVIPEPGKWRAIKALIASSNADWIALVDAGVMWERQSLRTLSPLLLQPDVMAVNPCFQELKGKALQKLIWSLEAGLKRLENLSGGPISLHGATILYRRDVLEQALKRLEGTDWLNDDVVLPLTLRTLFPESRIVYTVKTAVTDHFPSWDTPELQRRRRLLLGNIQWVQSFYLKVIKESPVVALLATRRLSRMIWAWWFVFCGLGVLGAVMAFTEVWIGLLLGGLAFGLGVMASRMAGGRRLLEAFWVSLAFPFYFISFRSKKALPRWK